MIRNSLAALAMAGALSGAACAADTRPAAPLDIVAFGDSLTSGYGLTREEAFPAQLERELTAQGHRVRIVNAGVSGDTTTSALRRFEQSVPADADAVIIALGANDMLWGQDPAVVHANLDRMITIAKARGQRVALLGMWAHPLWGARYQRQFDSVFADLAKKHGIPLDPFMLQDVALTAALNQDDGVHPNAAGARAMARRLAPFVVSAFGLGGDASVAAR